MKKPDNKLKLKVCGMCNPANVSEVLELKPDFVGFIFHLPSPRNCENPPDLLYPATTKRVAVTVDENFETLYKIQMLFHPDYYQLHGDETPFFCKKVKTELAPVIKAFRIDETFDFNLPLLYQDSSDIFLFDARGEKAGGNGIRFDWSLLQKYKGTTPFMISGGITPGMGKEICAIDYPQLLGVDINSGFENSPGIKNIEQIKQFKNEISGR